MAGMPEPGYPSRERRDGTTTRQWGLGVYRFRPIADISYQEGRTSTLGFLKQRFQANLGDSIHRRHRSSVRYAGVNS